MSGPSGILPRMNKKLINTGPSERGAHRLELALKCPALYAFTKLVKHDDTLTGREPLVRGSMGHAGFAHHYARLWCEQNNRDPEEFYVPHEAVDLVGAEMGATKTLRGVVHDTLDAYLAFHAVERVKPVAVEEPVRIMVPRPDGTGEHLFTQRWDLAVEDSASKVWVWDHKFVAKVEQKTVQRYALSIQFIGMVYCARRILGDRFGGVKLNLVGVNGGMRRENIPAAPDAERRFPATVAFAEDRIAMIEALSSPWDAPRVYSEQVCMGPYGACPCYDLCRFGKGHVTMDGRVL